MLQSEFDVPNCGICRGELKGQEKKKKKKKKKTVTKHKITTQVKCYDYYVYTCIMPNASTFMPHRTAHAAPPVNATSCQRHLTTHLHCTPSYLRIYHEHLGPPL
jgi:hypothetical protein